MRLHWLLAVGLLAVPASVTATALDNVGFTRLRAQLGEALPAGSGMRVTQVESSLASDHDHNPLTPKVRTWQPDVKARGLASKPIVVHATAPAAAYSSHATSVARLLIGQRGMATASTLEVRSASDWMGDHSLNSFSTRPPLSSASRVFSHSWAASISVGNTRILRRVDWLADHDEVIHVAGVRNTPDKTNQPLLAASLNAIVVGRSDGQHSRGTPVVDATYVAGRARPHLVAPLKSASAATPMVASAVLLLAEVSDTADLSTSDTPKLTRGGVELRDAGRPEVLRAVLMASADRGIDNKGYPDIDDYRGTPASRTDNGLDLRYGAGQLNVYKAYHLLRAGEQERSGAAGDRVATTGFDYVQNLFDETGATASYYLETDVAGEFNATLSWHLIFPGAGGERFDASAIYSDLDLCLYRLQGEREQLLSASAAKHDTTENLHLDLSPGLYRLEVRFTDSDNSVTPRQDYGLAWQFLAAGQD